MLDCLICSISINNQLFLANSRLQLKSSFSSLSFLPGTTPFISFYLIILIMNNSFSDFHGENQQRDDASNDFATNTTLPHNEFVPGTPPPHGYVSVPFIDHRNHSSRGITHGEEGNERAPDYALDFTSTPTNVMKMNNNNESYIGTAPMNVNNISENSVGLHHAVESNEIDENCESANTTTPTENPQETSTASDDITVSESVREVMGVQVPDNTMRNNATAMRCLAKFMVSQKFANDDLAAPDVFYFFFGEATKKPTNEQLEKFRNVLREFAVRYKQDDGSPVTPSTMINYMRSLNRGLKFFDYDVDIFTNTLFTDKKEGLLPVLDNHFAQQQSAGMVVKHHNTLPRDDLIKILDHPICDPKQAVGYVYRYIISFGIALGVRPTAMWELTISQFKRTTECGRKVYIYTERIGSRTGGSKTKKGGIKFISRAPVQVPLFDVDLLDGRLNFFKMFEHLLSIRPDCASDRMFLQVNRGRTKPEEFFKRQNLGRGFFERSVKTICNEAGVQGSGLNDYMTNHGLRSSMTSLLIDAGHTDSSIILRTGHSSATTLARYHNLRGSEGLRQQHSLFQDTGKELNECEPDPKRYKDNNESSPHKEGITDPTAKAVDPNESNVSVGIQNPAPPQSGSTSVQNENSTAAVTLGSAGSNVITPGAVGLGSFLHSISSSGSGSINITVNLDSKHNDK